MKRIQLKISKVFAVYVDDDVKTDDMETIHNQLLEDIERENTTPQIVFFDNLELVCSECGIDLNLDEEKEDGMCVQCGGSKDE